MAYGLSCMWDFPGPGLEPMSPALAGGFLTTAPPGKSLLKILKYFLYMLLHTEKIFRDKAKFNQILSQKIRITNTKILIMTIYR